MTPWTPVKGEIVKMTVSKTWGPMKGIPHCIVQTTVTDVSKAGYVKVAIARHERFSRRTDTTYLEWHPKAWGARDWYIWIERPLPGEVLPTTREEGRAYAAGLAKQKD